MSCPRKLRLGCSGRLTLTTSAKPARTLGSTRYRLRRGQSRRIDVVLTPSAERLLAARRRLDVVATAREHDARGRPKTTVELSVLRA